MCSDALPPRAWMAGPLRRSRSSSGLLQRWNLHPLTQLHNQNGARSCNALQVGETIRGQRNCRCRVCRSPTGVWRKDELEDEVEGCLMLAMGRLNLNSPPRPSSEQQPLSPGSPATSRMTLSRNSLKIQSNPWSPRRSSRATIESDLQFRPESLNLMPATPACSSRPRSAPAPVRQSLREQPKDIARATLNRRISADMAFVERCRQSWDAKMGLIEHRRQEREAQVVGVLEARKAAAADRAEKRDRVRQWMTMIHVIMATQCFHEFAVAGRMLTLASEGGETVARMVAWGRQLSAQRAVQSAIAMRCLRHPVQRLLLQHYSLVPAEADQQRSLHGHSQHEVVPRLEASAQHGEADAMGKLWQAAVVGFVFPQVRLLAVANNPVDREHYSSELQKAASKRQKLWQRWGVVLLCLRLPAKLLLKSRRRCAGRIITSFVLHLVVQNRMQMAFKNRMQSIRVIQHTVKMWLDKEYLKRSLLRTLLLRVESRVLTRGWEEKDVALMTRERRRLNGLRSLKERKNCERVIAIARENCRRYRRPKTKADMIHIQQLIDRHRLPPEAMDACIRQADATRRTRIQDELKKYSQQRQVYKHELQMWQDFQDAVQLMDPLARNPAPQPQPPKLPRLPFILDEADAIRIVRAARRSHHFNP